MCTQIPRITGSPCFVQQRLYCGKTAGFGWDVNGDKDDCESVDPAAIQETVLGMQEAELSEV